MRSNPPPFHPSTELLPENPTPISQADLATAKSNGTLDPNTTYEVVTSSMTGGVIYLVTDGNGIISHDARYFDAAISDQSLEVEYHCDTDRIHRAYDTVREVEVVGENEVDAFPWGNNSITESKFHNSAFTYTGGTIRGLFMTGESTLTNGGNIFDSVIQGRSNVTNNAGGVLNEVVINSDATVTNSGSINNSEFTGNSLVSNNGSLTNVESSSGGRITNSGTGLVNEVSVTANGFLRFTGSGRIYYSNIEANGLLYADNWSGNFYYNDVRNASSVYLDGSSGNVQRNTFDSYARVNLQRSVLDMYYNNVSTGQIWMQDNATSVRFRNNSVDSDGYVRLNNTAGGDFLYSKVSARGYFYSQTGYAGRTRYLSLTSNGQVNNANGFTGLINMVSVHDRGRLRLTDSAMQIQYSNFNSYTDLLGERGGTLSRIAYCTVERSSINARDVVDFRFYSNEVSGLATISFANGNGGYVHQCEFTSDVNVLADTAGFTGTVRYCSGSGGGTLNVRALTGVLQRTELHSNGRLTMSTGGTSSNLNYNNIAITHTAAISDDVQGY